MHKIIDKEEKAKWKKTILEKCIKQLALIVVRNVKFLSNLKEEKMFTVTNVLETENLEDKTMEADSEETVHQDKCIKQLALNVRRNVKFLSNQQKVNQFTVKNVL
jgi:hypothetical protein